MKRRGVGFLTILVIAGLIAYACYALSGMRAKVNDAERTRAELEFKVEQIQSENADLSYAIEHKDDPGTIEDIARDKLGLVMPEERVYYDAGD